MKPLSLRTNCSDAARTLLIGGGRIEIEQRFDVATHDGGIVDKAPELLEDEVINASHMVVYTRDAEADRAFFRDVLRLPSVDAGGGWLIFALPPAEVAFHPAEQNGAQELYLVCDDLQDTLDELEARGVRHGEPSEQNWGITTEIHLPGGGRLGLYQPKHPMAVSPGRPPG